jgi:hypothetical protein
VAAVENPAPSPSLPGRGSTSPAATFVSDGGALAEPIVQEVSNVTVVKLYPTLSASRRLAIQTVALDVRPNGGL